MNNQINTKTTRIHHGKWWHHTNQKSLDQLFLYLITNIVKRFPNKSQKPFIIFIDNLGLLLSRCITILFNIIKQTKTPYQIPSTTKKPIIILTTKNFIVDTILPKSIKPQPIPKEQSNKPDIILTKSDAFYTQYYQRKGHIILPEYITLILDTTPPLEDILNHTTSTIKRDINKAQSTPYSIEITSNPEKFTFFYTHIHKPYIKWKHQQSQRIASPLTIQHLALQKAKILFIKHKKEYIFGGIFTIESNMIKTYYAGLMKGKYNHLHNGIMAVSYYALINEAQKQHIQFIDFGTANPFLSSGLLNYKLQWNMHITKTSPYFSDIYAIKTNSTIFQKLFAQEPFFYYRNNTLTLAISDTLKQQQYPLLKQNILKQFPTITYTHLRDLH